MRTLRERAFDELEEQIETLKARLKTANEKLARYRKAESSRYRHENDHLSYEDDNYRD